MPFHKVLVANRGEIAVRIIRACKEMGIFTVAVFSEADRDALHVRMADEAYCIGPTQSKDSYLNYTNIMSVATLTEADAIHPGYGFLAENADFAEICESCNITFIGPSPSAISKMGDKSVAKQTMKNAGVPVIPGSDGLVEDLDEAIRIAREIGYPVLIKATAGGGGKGIRIAEDEEALVRQIVSAQQEAQKAFGNAGVYLEKYLTGMKHVEVQILADKHGNVVHLGERDCSIQRRRQKLIEETPPPNLPEKAIERIGALAVRAARAAGYVGAGTFEFVLDEDGGVYFIEANCRLQVEHPITEMVTGIDLVREQLQIAAGRRLSYRQQDVVPYGVALECRVNAEDPFRNFMPTPGVVAEFAPPGGPFTRVDTHVVPNLRVTADYDPLLAKVAVWAPTREEVLARMDRALGEFAISGPGLCTNLSFLRDVLAHPLFRHAKHTTSLVDQMMSTPIS